jgi:HSP20 family molecular chaperone IbpA
MKQEATAVQPQKKEATPIKFVPFNHVFDHMNEVHNAISRLAFELFEHNEQTFGHDLDDWLKAESQLLHPIHVGISDSGNALLVHAEVPGFSAEEVEVSLEPWRLTITGKRVTKEERKTAKTIYSEQCANQVLRVIDLPAEVDTTKVKATLKDGMLELNMAKAAQARNVLVKAKSA